ncbi:reverse transcriptase domain, reverse transcriptase zinc-binding domain protein [Tanacetum coccineum]
MSILVNGSPTEEFSLKRGVRQGDTLSSFLFILAAEGLNAFVKEAVDKGIFRGVKIGRNWVVLSHLQYADDIKFFGEWSKENVRYLMCILECFEEVSGLRVNYNKSKLYGVGLNDREIGEMARWIRCGVGEFPFTYLGLPIGENMRQVSTWNLVIDKFKKRLTEWKAKTMSLGGRLTLVKSVLGSLPLYYFSMFRENGGEGLKKEEGALWVMVINSIHGVSGGLGDVRGIGRVVKGGYVRREIIRIGEDFEGLGIDFTSSLEGVVRNGREVWFWIDRWVGREKLCDRFSMLYHLDSRKDGRVADKGKWINGEWQ